VAASSSPPPPTPPSPPAPPPAFTPVFIKSSFTLNGAAVPTSTAAQTSIATLLGVSPGAVVILNILNTPAATGRRRLLEGTTLINFQVLASSAVQQAAITTAIQSITQAQMAAAFPGTTTFTAGAVTIASTSGSSVNITLNSNKQMTIATIVIISLLFGLFILSAIIRMIYSNRADKPVGYGANFGASMSDMSAKQSRRRMLVGSSFLKGSNY
jgi:hypothetical protein